MREFAVRWRRWVRGCRILEERGLLTLRTRVSQPLTWTKARTKLLTVSAAREAMEITYQCAPTPACAPTWPDPYLRLRGREVTRWGGLRPGSVSLRSSKIREGETGRPGGVGAAHSPRFGIVGETRVLRLVVEAVAGVGGTQRKRRLWPRLRRIVRAEQSSAVEGQQPTPLYSALATHARTRTRSRSRSRSRSTSGTPPARTSSHHRAQSRMGLCRCNLALSHRQSSESNRDGYPFCI
jgi:hypothetical protein